jgi:histidyl-tRNA synthetase
MTDITVAIDKLDKIGIEKVKAELVERGLNDTQVASIQDYLAIDGPNDKKISALKALFAANPTGLQGIADLEYILSHNPTLTLDLTLARGLNYYTGAIFEVKVAPILEIAMGSIGGGGRYDDLTGTFGVPGIAGVGISFGVDRIYDVMEEANLFPSDVQTGTRVLFFNLGELEAETAFVLVQQLRDNDIPAELYHESAKFDKQFKYAERKGIPFAVIIGGTELASKTAKLKDLRDGTQRELSFEQITRPDLFR